MNVETILHRLRELVPETCMVEGGHLSPDGTLYTSEASAVVRAVASRQREFRAGRVYARRALRRLSIHPCPILIDHHRAPIWPHGVVGSIAHTKHVCVVVVSRHPRIASVGIDIEEATPLDEQLAPLIATPLELQRLPGMITVGCDPVKLLFVIKESVYKAYYPQTGAFLSFEDVEVRADPDAGRFEATLVHAASQRVQGTREIHGRFAIAAGHTIACAVVDRRIEIG